eukprot:COSAG01_NODE_6204_length_3796_cov_10.893968_6_plen_50_part_01
MEAVANTQEAGLRGRGGGGGGGGGGPRGVNHPFERGGGVGVGVVEKFSPA